MKLDKLYISNSPLVKQTTTQTDGGKKISDREKSHLYKEFATLLKSGMDLVFSIQIIIEQETKPKRKIAFQSILDKLYKGDHVYDAFNLLPGISDFEITCIRIGEETGRLIEIFEQLSKFYFERSSQRRMVIQSITYPLLVLTTAIGAVMFMLVFIVPVFADVYKRFDTDLPFITKAVIFLSKYVKWFFLGLFIIASFLIFMKFNRDASKFRPQASFISKLPILKKIFLRLVLLQWTQSMHLMLSSQLHLIKALEFSGLMIKKSSLFDSLTIVSAEVMKGTPLHQALADSKFMPPKLIAMIRIGEETNELPQMMQLIHEQMTEVMEDDIKKLSSILEPILILIVGVIVGVILISMYLPIFKLGTTIHT